MLVYRLFDKYVDSVSCILLFLLFFFFLFLGCFMRINMFITSSVVLYRLTNFASVSTSRISIPTDAVDNVTYDSELRRPSVVTEASVTSTRFRFLADWKDVSGLFGDDDIFSLHTTASRSLTSYTYINKWACRRAVQLQAHICIAPKYGTVSRNRSLPVHSHFCVK